jgi:hypothetical protein
MTDHVCNIFQRVRGRRPNPSSSFAAMGVDSLGAVLFLRILSDSLGGVRIAPSEVYAHGVTVRSFSEALHRRLVGEHPTALAKLGLLVSVEVATPPPPPA